MACVRTRTYVLIAALGLLVVLGACGGGESEQASDEPTTTAAPEENPTTTGPGSTTPPAGSNPASGGSGRKKVNYVPAGPTDDDTPDNSNRWYDLLRTVECDTLLRETQNAPEGNPATFIYRAAAQACLGQFDAAAQSLGAYSSEGGDSVDPDDCGRNYVVTFVNQALAAWRAEPGQPPAFEPGGSAQPCPKETTTTEATTESTGRGDGTEGGAGGE